MGGKRGIFGEDWGKAADAVGMWLGLVVGSRVDQCVESWERLSKL